METQIVQIKLVPAQTEDERKRNIIANIVVEEGVNSFSVPYIDDAIIPITKTQLQVVTASGLNAKQEGRKYLSYFAAGPSTYRIQCPLCRQHSNAAVMRLAGLKDASCYLSTLSCIFPVFWICCIYTLCGFNREWTTKGLYCSRCGGKVGIQRK